MVQDRFVAAERETFYGAHKYFVDLIATHQKEAKRKRSMASSQLLRTEAEEINLNTYSGRTTSGSRK